MRRRGDTEKRGCLRRGRSFPASPNPRVRSSYFILALNQQSPIRNLKSSGASYRNRTGVSALATPRLEPSGPTMQVITDCRFAIANCVSHYGPIGDRQLEIGNVFGRDG
jgi:hypothetical protein